MFNKLSIRSKLIIILIPLYIISILVLSFISYGLYQKQITDSSKNNLVDIISQTNRHLDSYLDELIRLTIQPYYSEDLLNILETNKKNSNFYHDYQKVEEFLNNTMINPRLDIEGVYLYGTNGLVFSKTLLHTSLNPQFKLKESKWYQDAINAGGNAIVFGHYEDNRLLYHPNNVFSIARAIRLYNGPFLGAIILDANFRELEDLFDKVKLGENANLIVIDQYKHIIFSKNNKYINLIDSIKMKGSNIQNVQENNAEFIVCKTTSLSTGWKIIGIVSTNELKQNTKKIGSLILIISIIVIITIITVSVLISHSVTKPLRELKTLINKVKDGDYSISTSFLSSYEFEDVGKAFKGMSERIDELVNQVLEYRYLKKEAELENLRLQIRPHFLYNSLESIRSLAEIHDDYEVTEMTSALGSFLRYTININEEYVTVLEEIRQIQNYLTIHQIRLAYQLDISIEIEDKIHDCLIIPMILQPIVENIVQYGINLDQNRNSLSIKGFLSSNIVIFKIIDNGNGIPKEKMEKLISTLKETNKSKEFGIGIKNVNSRIQLHYGNGYGVSIASKKDLGTVITINIPYLKRGDLSARNNDC